MKLSAITGETMANSGIKNLKPWKPGQSGNPSGRPASRTTVEADFWKALAADFGANGEKVIVACREKDPVAYFRTVASLMPKEVDLKHVTDSLSDDELDAAIAYFRSLANRGRAGEAEDSPADGTPAPGIPTVQ